MKSGRKLAFSIATILLSILVIALTHWGGLFLVTLVALVLSILYSFDYTNELRESSQKSTTQKIAGAALFVPQAVFIAITAVVGITIIVWVLYNNFIERQPEYTGGLLTFGVAPFALVFVARWLRSFRRKNKQSDEP